MICHYGREFLDIFPENIIGIDYIFQLSHFIILKARQQY